MLISCSSDLHACMCSLQLLHRRKRREKERGQALLREKRARKRVDRETERLRAVGVAGPRWGVWVLQGKAAFPEGTATADVDMGLFPLHSAWVWARSCALCPFSSPWYPGEAECTQVPKGEYRGPS